MAATARSEAYEGLVRKIGYSVGLEFLTQRVADLAHLYAAQGAVDGADWRDLVKEWGRPTAERHIADVYAQLDLVRRHRNTIQILPALDAIAILLRYPNPLTGKTDDRTNEAVAFILLWKVIEADGDIFLNALATGFKAESLRVALQDMIKFKRRVIAPLFRQAASIRTIMEAVSIRAQTESTNQGKRLTYAERSRQIRSSPAPRNDTGFWTEEDIVISDDYLDKACVTRRSWSLEFGLFDRAGGTLTPRGEKLLEALDQIGLAHRVGEQIRCAFWPYGFALRTIGITAEDLGIPDLSPFDLLKAVASSANESEDGGSQSIDRRGMLDLLTRILGMYQEVSRRGVLRHDLPLFVAEPVLVFWLMNAGIEIPEFRQFLRDELQRPDRGFDFVMIRGTEGGLRMMGV